MLKSCRTLLLIIAVVTLAGCSSGTSSGGVGGEDSVAGKDSVDATEPDAGSPEDAAAGDTGVCRLLPP